MAKHTIRILNFNLTLTSDDDKTYIENVAERVERNIKTLSDAMPTRNMTEVALFVAMDYCDRYMKAIGDGTSMRGQIKDYLKDQAAVSQQLEEVQKENEQLKAEIEKLRRSAADDDDRSERAADPALDVINTITMPKAEPSAPAEREPLFLRGKKASKGKKKENKPTPPVKGAWGADAFSESADAAADIMSFFEEKSFDDDD